MQVPLIQGTKTNIKAQFNDALLENMLVAPEPTLGYNGYIKNHPGIKLTGECSGTSRGGIYNDRLDIGFRVVGNSLISLTNTGEQDQNLGVIAGSGQVAMPFSFNTQSIVTQQGKMYLYSVAGGLTEVTDPDLGDVFDATWIDGYYFLVDKESPIVTDILAEDSIRQLNYGSAEIDPDPIRGCGKWRNFAVVFGSATMEFYDNVGGLQFPFQRVESYTIYIGIVGTHAKVKLPKDAGFVVLGGSRGDKASFHIAVNGTSTNIATKSIERILDSYSEDELATTKIEFLKDEAQDFIYVHLPRDTLIYDMTTSKKLGYHQWSILKTGFKPQASFTGYWQGINSVKIPLLNEYTWGNRNIGVISQFDRETCLQLSKQQEHIIYTPLVKIPKFTLYEISPQVLEGRNAIAIDESIFLSITEDGESYTNEVSEDFGKRGARWDQLIWRRLGYFKNWVGSRVRYVGKTNLTLIDLEYNPDE